MTMLGSLRRKFILMTTALVGIVLAGVLAASVWTSWSQSVSQLEDSLRMALMDAERPMGVPGMDARLGPAPMDGFGQGAGQSVIVFEYEDGEVEMDDLYYLFYDLDEAVIEEMARTIASSPATSGILPESNLRWMKMADDEGCRIAICDSSVVDGNLAGQIARALVILLFGTAAVALISMFLARWALAPVEEAWEQQKRFVADASHELKTPLSVILANSQILSAHGDRIPAEEMRWIEGSAEEAQRMKALVEDLLELARVDDGAAKPKAAALEQDIDFSDMVSRIALQFEAIAFEHGCAMDAQVENGIHVTGDATGLERLVSILVENACKYSAPGSPIRIVLRRDGSRRILSVANQGDPIPADDLPHVFERFYRSDAARTRNGTGGYGLGLAIAKGIADAHGAELGVSSSADTGTVFTFSI